MSFCRTGFKQRAPGLYRQNILIGVTVVKHPAKQLPHNTNFSLKSGPIVVSCVAVIPGGNVMKGPITPKHKKVVLTHLHQWKGKGGCVDGKHQIIGVHGSEQPCLKPKHRGIQRGNIWNHNHFCHYRVV